MKNFRSFDILLIVAMVTVFVICSALGASELKECLDRCKKEPQSTVCGEKNGMTMTYRNECNMECKGSS